MTGHFLQVLSAKVAAVTHLTDSPALCSAQKLYFAAKFSIPIWLRPSLRELIQAPVPSFTPRDVLWINHHNVDAFRSLIVCGARIAVERRTLAVGRPPARHSAVCQHQEACSQRWYDLYEQHAKYLIAPHVYYSGYAALELLEQEGRRLAGPGSVMPVACLEANTENAREKGYWWKREFELMEEGMQEILGEMITLPPVD